MPKPKLKFCQDGVVIRDGDMVFTWDICGGCGVMVRCPGCGNNSCNGGSGEVDGKPCKVCHLTHQYVMMAEKAKLYPTVDELLKTWPKKKQAQYKKDAAASKKLWKSMRATDEDLKAL